MKKRRFLTPIVIAVLCLIVIMSASWNAILLAFTSSDFKHQIKAADGVEFIEIQSTYGKLVGNGNGIQYFGAALVKAESEDQVRQLVAQLDADFESVGYAWQTDRVITAKQLEHQSLRFEYADYSDGGYYRIYYFNSQHPLSNLSDPMGH